MFARKFKETRGFPMAQIVKNLPASAGEARDSSFSPGSGRSPGGRNGTPLQDPCCDNSQAEEAGGLQSTGSQELDTTERLNM